MKVFIMQKSKSLIKNILIVLFWLFVWQVLALTINQEILLPTPVATIKALVKMLNEISFYLSVFYSLLRIVIGYLSGVLIGILGGVLSYKIKTFKAIFSPILTIIKAVPIASFIILALVWFKGTTLPIFISFLIVVPIIWSTTETGLNNINKNLLELAFVYRLNPLKIFFKIKLPLIMPNLITAALTAMGFAWKSGVAAEVICKPENSLGNILQNAKIYLEIPQVFAVTIVVAILSIILETSIKLILRRYSNDKY